MFPAALPSAFAAGEAIRRIIAAEDLTVRPAVAIAATAAVADAGRRDSEAAALALRLAGRTVPALVLQKLDDGTASVQIEGESLQVAGRLPEAGRTVLLRFPPASQDARAGAGTPPVPVAGTAAGVSVGALAHALSDAAQMPARPLPLGPIHADPARPGDFATALAAVVRDSGMFYESHLARWSQGQYPLALLQREPQAAAGPAPPLARASGTPADAAPSAPQHAEGPAGSVAAAATQTALPEGLQPVIREQLQVLENRSLAVMIEPWPGQAARLEIAQEEQADNERDGQAGAAGGAAWKTRLSLDLPTLGRIDAELALAGNRLSVLVRADPETAPQLARNATGLARAMADAGIRMAGCKVVDHGAD